MLGKIDTVDSLLAFLGDIPYVFISVYLYTPCPKLQPETFTEGTNMTSVYLSSGVVINKGADQPAHPRSLISAFVFCSFESIISRLSIAKETGLSLALSKTLKTGIFCVEAQRTCNGLAVFWPTMDLAEI